VQRIWDVPFYRTRCGVVPLTAALLQGAQRVATVGRSHADDLLQHWRLKSSSMEI
jgi:hypothetical protein